MKIIERNSDPAADEPAERECRTCLETKPIDKFKKVPSGKRMGVCASCQSSKANKTRYERAAAITEPQDHEQVTDARINKELWKQYRAAKTTSERIRCLEALVKLRPEDKKTKLDDEAVVQSLIDAMRAKKKAAASS